MNSDNLSSLYGHHPSVEHVLVPAVPLTVGHFGQYAAPLLFLESMRNRLSGETATRPLFAAVSDLSDFLILCAQHKNLGILTTLRIGIDDSNGNGRWLMDHILVRNEVTGHTYK